MKRKCDSCDHFATTGELEVCLSRSVVRIGGRRGSVHLNLEAAREICNKEGDGIFVYFEPREEETSK